MFKLFLLEQQSERVHSHLLVDSPQMLTMARVEQGLCQELEMQCRCPCGLQSLCSLSHLL